MAKFDARAYVHGVMKASPSTIREFMKVERAAREYLLNTASDADGILDRALPDLSQIDLEKCDEKTRELIVCSRDVVEEVRQFAVLLQSDADAWIKAFDTLFAARAEVDIHPRSRSVRYFGESRTKRA
jgi:hypothetical protein